MESQVKLKDCTIIQFNKEFYYGGEEIVGAVSIDKLDYIAKEISLSLNGVEELINHATPSQNTNKNFIVVQTLNGALPSISSQFTFPFKFRLPDHISSSLYYSDSKYTSSINYYLQLTIFNSEGRSQIAYFPLAVRTLTQNFSYAQSIDSNVQLSSFCSNSGESKVTIKSTSESFVWGENVSMILTIDNSKALISALSMKSSLIRKTLIKSVYGKCDFASTVIASFNSCFHVNTNELKRLNFSLDLQEPINKQSKTVTNKDNQDTSVRDQANSTVKSNYISIEYYVDAWVEWEGGICSTNKCNIQIPVLIYSKVPHSIVRALPENWKPIVIEQDICKVPSNDMFVSVGTMRMQHKISSNMLSSYEENPYLHKEELPQNFNTGETSLQNDQFESVPENSKIQIEIEESSQEEMQIDQPQVEVGGIEFIPNAAVVSNLQEEQSSETLSKLESAENNVNEATTLVSYLKTPNGGEVIEDNKSILVTYRSFLSKTSPNGGEVIETPNGITITYKTSTNEN